MVGMRKNAQNCASATTKCWKHILEFATLSSYRLTAMILKTGLAGQLSGWKEIAAYLRVSVRTAQSLEKDQGLPVRRASGAKGHVFAFSSELDEWRQLPQNLSPDAVLPVPTAGHGDRRQWLRLMLGGAATLAAGAGLGYGIPRFQFGHRNPASYRVEGDELIVYSKDSTELWRHSFGRELDGSAYSLRKVSSGENPCQFADLNGDSSVNTLFRFVPKEMSEEYSLDCFERDGRLRWKFVPGKTVIDNLGRNFAPPYWPNSFQIVRSKGSRKQVVVSSHHNWSFPTQLAVLDSKTGRLLSDYWHRGHLLHMVKADLNGDGKVEIILGGVNDAPEYKQATLVIFEPANISGCSKNPRGGLYFQGMKPGTEKNEVFFPKTPFGQRAEFNLVVALRAVEGRILVGVGESTVQTDPCAVVYELDYGLRPLTVALTNALRERYRQAWDAGTLPRESFTAVAERLKAGIVVV